LYQKDSSIVLAKQILKLIEQIDLYHQGGSPQKKNKKILLLKRNKPRDA